MNTRIATTFAFRNLKANKILYIPFILSSGVMTGLFNIMIGLMGNDYVNQRHEMLPRVIIFGILIVGLFTGIFVIYAGRFLSRRRSKEYALYTILGLEKKHIKRIVFVEYVLNMLTVMAFSVGLGYVLGKFLFLMLNRAMHDMNVKLMNYPFSLSALGITLAYIVGIFALLFIDGIWNLRKVSAIELMSQSKSGEKEPKLRFIPLILGILTMGVGYGIALNVSGTLKSFVYFFIAAVLVAIGTYMLFVSLSIAILKAMKMNKKYYYRGKNFLSVSGMLYRMKSNGLGLASIAVLCTGVIITISVTFAINDSLKTMVEKAIKTDYLLDSYENISVTATDKDVEKAKEKIKMFVENSILSDEKIEKLFISEGMFVQIKKDGEILRSSLDKKGGEDLFLQVSTLDSYNRDMGTKYVLGKNQVLLTSNRKALMNVDSITLAGNKKGIIKVKDNISGNVGVEMYSVIVKGHRELTELAKYYKLLNTRTGKTMDARISLTGKWNVGNNSEAYWKNIKKMEEQTDFKIHSKREMEATVYDLNGGFLFLGLIIGTVFLIGTMLITYYKQISEGYEDRNNYQIMKKVGLPDDLIKKTASSQIIWMFFIPLVVALVHSLVASKIVYQLLGLFGFNSYMKYLWEMTIVIGAFALIYLVIFKLTSNIYYKIVR